MEVPMAYNESDDKSRRQNEIRQLEQERAYLDSQIASLVFKKKMLGHRIADLKYEISHPSNSHK